MIVLLSPAKTLDPTPSTVKKFTSPRLLDKSEALVKTLKKKSVGDLQQLMSVSEKIAQLNVERYEAFATPFSLDNAKQAALLFKGDVYQAFKAETFDTKDLTFAQKYVRILSGLYGILRPLDLMQAYRLEMGTKLKNGKFKNLYEFWDQSITDIVNADLTKSKSKVVLNLASKEYFKSIQPKELIAPLVNVHFKELRGDKYKIIAFNAKKARGAMAHQIVKFRITKVEDLKDLDVNGYLYNEELSEAGELVFVK